jgi:hypothetical protein
MDYLNLLNPDRLWWDLRDYVYFFWSIALELRWFLIVAAAVVCLVVFCRRQLI